MLYERGGNWHTRLANQLGGSTVHTAEVSLADDPSCINCGYSGETRRPPPSDSPRERLQNSAPPNSEVTRAVLALLASGHPYTISQIATTLHIPRRRIDAISQSLLDNNLATIAGHSGRARLLRKP